jgi:phospholipase D1/2
MVFRPGQNVWRIERASRMAILIDAAAFFRAVREALLRATRSVFIVGWDLHSRTRLVGETDAAEDAYPELLADFLTALAKERPELTIRLLLWDYSVLYANERELFPRLRLDWKTPPNVRFSLDSAVPLGSSQHQKLIVVDDAVAFSGGLDVTIRRWDTPAHELDDSRRVDDSGAPYRPFHDVQAVVDGGAARALSRIAHARWTCATGEHVPPCEKEQAPWPASVAPDFSDVNVAVARTQPAFEDQREVREVEQLFLDMVDAAERSIYIENQFLTCPVFAERLARRLRERRQLEVLIVAPQTHQSWLEARTMRNGRIRFLLLLHEAAPERVRIVYPRVTKGDRATDTMVHSKVMIVDDRLLRIGSANLNNRSMGTDTECDLAIHAVNDRERAAIAQVRNRLIGEHCGVEEEEVAALLAETGSILAAADRLSRNGHALCPIEDGDPDPPHVASYIERLADPERPLAVADLLPPAAAGTAPGRLPVLAKVGGVVAMVIGLTLAWYYTPLADFAHPQRLGAMLDAVANAPFAPLIVVGGFILLELVAFPVNLLIAATAAAFGPWLGFLYGGAGSLASALVAYGVGVLIGTKAMRELLGERLDRIRSRMDRGGMLAIMAVRLVPVAPFALVNMAAGAVGIRLFDYTMGTILGMAPGLIVMSALGYQVLQIIARPTPNEILLLVVAVVGWIAIAVGAQTLVAKYLREKS